jgi:hypothetical protein
MIFRDPFNPYSAPKCLQHTLFVAGNMAPQTGGSTGEAQ